MTQESISFSIDEQVKREAEKLFEKLGLTTEEAITVFIKQSIRERGIPFKITMNPKNNVSNLSLFYEEEKAIIDKDSSNDKLDEELENPSDLIKEIIQDVDEELTK
jgi:DNA-damage-inducible protein J